MIKVYCYSLLKYVFKVIIRMFCDIFIFFFIKDSSRVVVICYFNVRDVIIFKFKCE